MVGEADGEVVTEADTESVAVDDCDDVREAVVVTVTESVAEVV